ncbi:hypothetical protein BGH94_06825 [Snodgrassella alvi]|nr:hypothetical protein BGH94_06825 [Snodgrassella alvi]ORE99623.1 hypothetical protein BGH95_10045 [Snodgrassella alvi]PIT31749.1 hypothetical protein BHC50_08360 [Snodgrassella alvi]PIT36659.1 hypothetical protein BHC42_00645 [Snodgrassella alvi]
MFRLNRKDILCQNLNLRITIKKIVILIIGKAIVLKIITLLRVGLKIVINQIIESNVMNVKLNSNCLVK